MSLYGLWYDHVSSPNNNKEDVLSAWSIQMNEGSLVLGHPNLLIKSISLAAMVNALIRGVV